MVIGNAKGIYTDYNAFNNAPELFLLLIFNVSLLGLVLICFIYYSLKNKSNASIKGKQNQKEPGKKDLSKFSLIKMIFIHPYQTQDQLLYEDPLNNKGKFLNRTVILLVSCIMVIFFLILIFDILSMVNYHIQYYEDKSQSLIDILNSAKLFLLIAGPPLTFVCSVVAIKIYTKLNRSQIKIALANHHLNIDETQINTISITSIIWFIPVLVFSFFLLYFTTANSFKDAIHRLFVGSGSILFVYNEVSLLIREFITNLFIIVMVSIPSLVICLKIFSNGISQCTNRVISRKRISIISLTSYILLVTMFFVLISLLFFGIKLIFSLVGIEGFISA
jgi:hypothetical protein